MVRYSDSNLFNNFYNMFPDLIELVKPSVIVEVGSYLGDSATYMAELCKNSNIKTEILCLDTWLGSHEHWDAENVSRINGYPTTYYQFMANVILEGHEDCITPVPLTSMSGAVLLAKKGVLADFIYIDAGHEYEEVIAEMRAFWPLLRSGGIFVGDDYHAGSPGVVRAFEEFCNELGVSGIIAFPKWIIRKP